MTDEPTPARRLVGRALSTITKIQSYVHTGTHLGGTPTGHPSRRAGRFILAGGCYPSSARGSYRRFFPGSRGTKKAARPETLMCKYCSTDRKTGKNSPLRWGFLVPMVAPPTPDATSAAQSAGASIEARKKARGDARAFWRHVSSRFSRQADRSRGRRFSQSR